MSKPAPAREIRERPILMSGPMVRAILEGSKTQTRRVIVPQPTITKHMEPYRQHRADAPFEAHWSCLVHLDKGDYRYATADCRCPYGKVGDRLWVRETHGIFGADVGTVSVGYKARLPTGKTLADTDGGLDVIRVEPETRTWVETHIDLERWRPSIFMPRWASRLTLEIKNIRVEQLQDISEEDAIAEGVDAVSLADVPRQATMSRRADYRQLWNTINAKRGHSWESNPWVWAITFKKVEQ